MPISRDLNTIFIHIPKTGGQSVNLCLGTSYKSEKNLVGIYPDDGIEPSHYTALEIKKIVPKIFDSYFKFAIVRNPYDKLVSEYYFGNGESCKRYLGLVPETFHEFIVRTYQVLKSEEYQKMNQYQICHIRPQTDFFLDETGKTIVNSVLRYENINKDMPVILANLGIIFPFPHVNKSKRDCWIEYYDRYTLNLVNDMYKNDFELMGYKII